MKALTLLMIAFSTMAVLPASAASQKIVYEIVAPEGLERFAKYEIDVESKREANGEMEVVYRLPKVLLGQETEFRFRGKADFAGESFTLRAPNAELRCASFPFHALCQAKYRKVKVDLEGVRAELESLPLSQEEKSGRFQMAAMIADGGGDFAGKGLVLVLVLRAQPSSSAGE
jgi:hypothetical protein